MKQLQVKDLRIGNLVEYDMVTHVVDGVNQDGIVGFFEKEDVEEKYRCSIDLIKPIPLTEDKLIEFGFESKGYECPETGYKETFPYSISLGGLFCINNSM